MLPKDLKIKTMDVRKNPLMNKLNNKGLKIKCFAINCITDFLFIATKEDVYLYSLNNY